MGLKKNKYGSRSFGVKIFDRRFATRLLPSNESLGAVNISYYAHSEDARRVVIFETIK